MQTWFVLSNDVGTILGVYGSALRDIALESKNRIQAETACNVYLHEIVGKRPSVGGSISMKGMQERS